MTTVTDSQMRATLSANILPAALPDYPKSTDGFRRFSVFNEICCIPLFDALTIAEWFSISFSLFSFFQLCSVKN